MLLHADKLKYRSVLPSSGRLSAKAKALFGEQKAEYPFVDTWMGVPCTIRGKSAAKTVSSASLDFIRRCKDNLVGIHAPAVTTTELNRTMVVCLESEY